MAVGDPLYPSHQGIHLAQGGSVDAPARGGGRRRGNPQRDVHMGQRQVEEEGTSAVAAQGRGGTRSVRSGKRKVAAGGHQGGDTAEPGDTDLWPFLRGALQPPLPLLQLPGGKTSLCASAGCKPSGHLLPLQGECLVRREPLLPCSGLNLSPLSTVLPFGMGLPVPPSPGVLQPAACQPPAKHPASVHPWHPPASLPSLMGPILAIPRPPQQVLGPHR